MSKSRVGHESHQMTLRSVISDDPSSEGVKIKGCLGTKESIYRKEMQSDVVIENRRVTRWLAVGFTATSNVV